jgi:hypothetical protein
MRQIPNGRTDLHTPSPQRVAENHRSQLAYTIFPLINVRFETRYIARRRNCSFGSALQPAALTFCAVPSGDTAAEIHSQVGLAARQRQLQFVQRPCQDLSIAAGWIHILGTARYIILKSLCFIAECPYRQIRISPPGFCPIRLSFAPPAGFQAIFSSPAGKVFH